MWLTGSYLHLIAKFRGLQSGAELHSIFPVTAHDLAKILSQKHLLKLFDLLYFHFFHYSETVLTHLHN